VSEQEHAWLGKFGQQYTDRNAATLEELEGMYKTNYGISRTELNLKFLEGIDRKVPILEVGANIGNQLMWLQKMGFSRLHGIELQSYALRISRSRALSIDMVQGSAFDMPFKDVSFDLIFTSGLLIHIHPSQVTEVMKEIHRCTRRYIWGLEYYADEFTEVSYRGHQRLLWKSNYAKLFLEGFHDLELVKEERLKYLDSDLVDTMYLLEKK
jgi:pseudaminic acid biosynthesis-associated methylase